MKRAITINNSKRLGYNSGAKGIITPKTENSVNLYFNEVNKLNFANGLSKEEEFKLFEKIKQGDEAARTRLINANLRFVISVAKLYIGQGLPFEDLINEGNIGLIRCIKRFDTKKNIKFLSYAVWYIRQAMLQAIFETGRNVKVPMNKKESLLKVNKKIAELEKELERKPSMQEIADSIENYTYDKVYNVMSSHHTEISLDAPLNSEGENETNMYDFLIADEISTLNKVEELNKDVFDLLKDLPYKKRRVLQRFFGVMVQEDSTLEEIGKEFGVCGERIRQIKDEAIRDLRDNPKIKKLMHYI